MEIEVNNLQAPNSLSILDKEYLKESAKWGKFLSIVGFIGLGLLALIALVMGFVMNNIGGGAFNSPNMPFGGMQYLLTIVYLSLAVLYFFPTLYLFNFSNKMQTALKSEIEMDYTEAFKNLKSMFKFWGIFTIIILSIYAFAFLIMAVIAAAR